MTSEKNRKWWALSGLSMACLIGYLDFAIVNTALPEIQKELGVSFVVLQWVMNVFVLALSIFMVNMGRFGDTFGRRPMLYIGLVLFGIASLFSGLASNGLVLITFRALQGLGLAMIIPSSLALISDTFPESERGRAIGIWTSITGLGVALGPVLGGIITSALSWRWIFFVNIPILTVAAAICLISVKESVRGAGEKTIDWYGFFLMMIGIGTLVSAIIQGPEWGWDSAMTILFFLISVISLVLLYIVESRVKSPIIDFKLFMSRGFLSGAFANFTLVAFAYSAFFLMPLYLGNILRKEAFEIGLLLLPITVLVIMVAPLAGKVVDSRGAKLPILAGLSALALKALIQSTYKPDSSLIYIVFGFLFMGLGWGSDIRLGGVRSYLLVTEGARRNGDRGALDLSEPGRLHRACGRGGDIRDRERASLDSGLTGAGIELAPEQKDLIRGILSDPENARHVLSQFTDAMSGRILPIFENAFMKGYSSTFIFLLCLSAGAFILIALIMKDVKRAKPGN